MLVLAPLPMRMLQKGVGASVALIIDVDLGVLPYRTVHLMQQLPATHTDCIIVVDTLVIVAIIVPENPCIAHLGRVK
jgi:hypothetical protein